MTVTTIILIGTIMSYNDNNYCSDFQLGFAVGVLMYLRRLRRITAAPCLWKGPVWLKRGAQVRPLVDYVFPQPLGNHWGNTGEASSGAILGLSWGCFRSLWAVFGASWGSGGPSGGSLGLSLGALGPSGAFGCRLGASQGCLGAVLWPSWGSLWPSWGSLGLSWGSLGPSYAILGLC